MAASPISLMGPAYVAHGWMLIGFTLNVLLLGVMITQVYLYYSQYKKDKLWMKIFVAVLFIADIMNTVFIFIYLFRALITFYGDADFLTKTDWLFATDPALAGIIASSVQMFFAWRVLVLTKKWYYAIIIASLALLGGTTSLITACAVGRRNVRFVDLRSVKTTGIVWLAAEAIGDILITTILVWHLCRQHKTGFRRSDKVVDRIIRATVQTGMITMIVASLDLLFYLIDPTGTHLLFNFPLCKLYSNSLMSSLNSRGGWKFGETSVESQAKLSSNGTLKPRTGPGGTLKLESSRSYPEVFVHVEQHELREAQTPAMNANPQNPDQKAVPLGYDTSVEKPLEEKWAQERKWAGEVP